MILAFLFLYLSSQYLAAQIPAEEQSVKEQLRIADSLYQQDRFQEAQESYLKILSVFPDSAEAIAGAGKCYVGMGRLQKAVPFLSEAVRRKPADREAKRILAHVYVDLNQFIAAESLLNSLLAADEKDKERPSLHRPGAPPENRHLPCYLLGAHGTDPGSRSRHDQAFE
jgi:tetratricopeptide (TPR) repeat protein